VDVAVAVASVATLGPTRRRQLGHSVVLDLVVVATLSAPPETLMLSSCD
jgi:hypothetical protein